MKTTPMMSFGDAVKTCFKKYATFSGRARRSEYWWFGVLDLILGAITGAVIGWTINALDALGTLALEAHESQEKYNAFVSHSDFIDNVNYPLLGLLALVWLVLVLPGLSVSVRRLHDTGRSGWFLLLGLIPVVNFIGSFVLLYFSLQDSKPEENQYGPSPKYIA